MNVQTSYSSISFSNSGSDLGKYRFRFNGQEKDDEVAGTGNTMTAEFWEYDSRLGRRWNVDSVKKAWRSNYHAFGNKSILNVDPNDDNAGKYYDQNGNEVGDDHENDEKSHVVTDSEEASNLRTNTLNNINPEKGKVKSDFELLSYSVRQQMGKAIEASNSPTIDDATGGFHEEGGAWGVTGDGLQKAIPAVPGPYANPSEVSATMNPLLPQNPENANLMEIFGTYHVHPAGLISTEKNVISNRSNHRFQSSPTDPDNYDFHNNHNHTRYSIVFGARKGETKLYNGNAKLLTVKTSVFLSIGKP